MLLLCSYPLKQMQPSLALRTDLFDPVRKVGDQLTWIGGQCGHVMMESKNYAAVARALHRNGWEAGAHVGGLDNR
jgi:hypothetical protein